MDISQPNGASNAFQHIFIADGKELHLIPNARLIAFIGKDPLPVKQPTNLLVPVLTHVKKGGRSDHAWEDRQAVRQPSHRQIQA